VASCVHIILALRTGGLDVATIYLHTYASGSIATLYISYSPDNMLDHTQHIRVRGFSSRRGRKGHTPRKQLASLVAEYLQLNGFVVDTYKLVGMGGI